MLKKRLSSEPNIHTFLGQVKLYLELEQKMIPADEREWVKKNQCALECVYYLKEFFTPKPCILRGCPDGWPQCCIPPQLASIRARTELASIRARKAKR